jgi:hypothetical protein
MVITEEILGGDSHSIFPQIKDKNFLFLHIWHIFR